MTYEVTTDTGESVTVTNPSEYPDGRVAEVAEPVVKVGILLPKDYVGTVMELCQAAPRDPPGHGLPQRGPRRAALQHAPR